MIELTVLLIAILFCIFLYVYSYKYLQEKDILHVTLIRYDTKSNTTFTKEFEIYKNDEGNFSVKLEAEFPRYVCCSSFHKNEITIETNKNMNSYKRIHYIMTNLGMIKVYDS